MTIEDVSREAKSNSFFDVRIASSRVQDSTRRLARYLMKAPVPPAEIFPYAAVLKVREAVTSKSR